MNLDQLYAAIMRERAKSVPTSTLQAAEYLVGKGDPVEFKQWLERHDKATQEGIREHLRRRK